MIKEGETGTVGGLITVSWMISIKLYIGTHGPFLKPEIISSVNKKFRMSSDWLGAQYLKNLFVIKPQEIKKSERFISQISVFVKSSAINFHDFQGSSFL